VCGVHCRATAWWSCGRWYVHWSIGNIAAATAISPQRGGSSCFQPGVQHTERHFRTPLLQELHWLKVLERIQSRLFVLSYRSLHASGPQYMARIWRWLATWLRSSSTSVLLVLTTRRITLGSRAFPVATAYSASLEHITTVSIRTSSSYLAFKRDLKTFFYKLSFDEWHTCATSMQTYGL